MIVSGTVKASNFEPRGNFGIFFRGACYHYNASYWKMKGLKIVEILYFRLPNFVPFVFVLNSTKEATDLRGFYGIPRDPRNSKNHLEFGTENYSDVYPYRSFPKVWRSHFSNGSMVQYLETSIWRCLRNFKLLRSADRIISHSWHCCHVTL